MRAIDAGETALVEELRVAPWERGKGVARLLQRFRSQLSDSTQGSRWYGSPGMTSWAPRS